METVKANEGRFQLECGHPIDLRDPMCREGHVRFSILIRP